MSTVKAKFGGGKVQVFDDNLTDISENLFWFREAVDQGQVDNATALQAIIILLTDISGKLSDINIPSHIPTIEYLPSPTVQNNYIEHSPREKLSKKLIAAADWITVNDPDSKLSVRQVASGAGVSIGTASAAIKLVNEEKRSK